MNHPNQSHLFAIIHETPALAKTQGLVQTRIQKTLTKKCFRGQPGVSCSCLECMQPGGRIERKKGKSYSFPSQHGSGHEVIAMGIPQKRISNQMK